MDYATTLCGQVTKGSCSMSLLYKYNFLPCPHRVIRPNYTCGHVCKQPAKLFLPSQYTPLCLGSGLSFFLMLSSLLAVEDKQRIRKGVCRIQSPLRVIEFYYCGNHLSQEQMTAQGSKSLNIRFRVGSLQENSIRSLCLIRVLYIQNTHSLYYYLMFASRPPLSRLQEVDFIFFYFFFLIFILF